MATCSQKSVNKVFAAPLLGKRKLDDDLETQTILKKHKETSEEKETTKDVAEQIELLETKPNLISVKEAAVRKKTLFVGNIPCKTKIPNIIDFFKNVGEIVRLQLILSLKGTHVGCGFVEFASSNEAEKALQKKNGEYLGDHKIVLEEATKGAKYLPPKYCLDHKVWCKDYLRREGGLPTEEEETPLDSVEEVLFVANLSPQTKLLHVINFFENVGKVVSVRLIVNSEGKHVGYGFVEFASADKAKKAMETKNGEYLHDHKIFLEVAKSVPYPPQPKYNLAEMLCYEDYLRRQKLLLEEDETPPDSVEAVAAIKKTLFVTHLSHQIVISHIINFFKDVGEVVHVRLMVNHKGKHERFGFVEFASSNEAKKALEKNGEYLHDRKISLELAKKAPYSRRPKYYCFDHKVWYEDYLRRESLLIDEDEAVEGLDETPDFVEEFTVRKKTLFFSNLSEKIRISNIINFFKDVGEVVHVRLIVNHKGNNVGCGFVQFASIDEAKKALRKKCGKNFLGRDIFLDVAEIAPYPLRPRYNLAEKLWYEDYLRQESLLIEEDDLETKPNLKKKKVPTMGEFCGNKITFSEDSEDSEGYEVYEGED